VEAEADTAATVGSGEIQELKEQIAKMQAEIAKIPAMQSEIENLKKQLAQVLAFIKQKLK
jgi:prefoldin subunit 5